MRSLLGAILLLTAVTRPLAAGSFVVTSASARSQGMGDAFVSLADDAGAVFSNPAGLVLTASHCLWADYAEPAGTSSLGEGRLGGVLSTGNTAFAATGYRHALRDRTRNVLLFAVARNLVEGTEGSFLSVGVAFKAGRLLADRACLVCPGRDADTQVSGDAGFIIRPLPFVSIGYAVQTLVERTFAAGAAGESWERTHRLGAAWLWEEKVTIAVEREKRAGESVLRYGVAVRASWGIELTGGIVDMERVAGGIRWSSSRLRLAASFVQAEDGVTGRVGVEFFPNGRKEGIGG